MDCRENLAKILAASITGQNPDRFSLIGGADGDPRIKWDAGVSEYTILHVNDKPIWGSFLAAADDILKRYELKARTE